MKKVLIISLFILGMIIPGLNAKAVDVSNEQQLRAAIEQGGDITLTQNIEVTQQLVINKDVNISGSDYYSKSILMQGDNTLMTINSGNVTLAVDLYAGWNGGYDKYDNPTSTENQGKAIVVNNGNIKLSSSSLEAGNVGLEVNDGIVTGSSEIYAGEYNENNYTYSGGQGMIVNGGKIELDGLEIYSGGTALTLNKGSNVTLTNENKGFYINSYEGNGIEVNDGSIVKINSTNDYSSIFGSQNAIYLNGGTVNLDGTLSLTEKFNIYVNKGVNILTNSDILTISDTFKFKDAGGFIQIELYVNPQINELKVADSNNMFSFEDNKLKIKLSQTFFYSHYLPSESNDIPYTTVYINGEKQNEVDASCNPVVDKEENNQGPEVVKVPATSAYASVIIAILGIICVIISVFIMRRVTKNAN